MRTTEKTASYFRRGIFVGVVCLGMALVYGCSVNPATGRRQLMLISESEEIELGRDANEGVVAQLGLHDDTELQQFVSDLGKRLAAASERPDLPWTFQVVDDPVVNAFALPGGFIYVTRGILAHLDSTAGLAGVLGHEIGHVTARHGASRMSRGLLAQIGLGVSAAVSPELASAAGVAQSGLGLLFLKYGRDDERQADSLGFRYSERVGYDPRAMIEVFEMLERTSRRADAEGSVPSWLSTHPAPDARQARAQDALAGRDELNELRRGRDGYVLRLDGMVYGANPREGYFRGDRFLHPSLAFEMTFPVGWRHRNQRSGVVSLDPDGRAAVVVALATEGSAAAAAAAFGEGEDVQTRGSWRSEIGGVDVESVRFRREGDDGATLGIAVFVEQEGRVLRLLGVAVEDASSESESAMRSALASFRRVHERAILDVQPLRIETEVLSRDQTALALAESYECPVTPEELAVLNGVDEGELMLRGVRAKRIVGRRPPQ